MSKPKFHEFKDHSFSEQSYRSLPPAPNRDHIPESGVPRKTIHADGPLNSLGFRQLAEDRLGQFVPTTAVHRPGKMIADLVSMLATGGEHVTDTDQLRQAPGVFGQVASEATFSRLFTRLTEHPGAFDYAFATMQREVRSRLWAAV